MGAVQQQEEQRRQRAEPIDRPQRMLNDHGDNSDSYTVDIVDLGGYFEGDEIEL